MEIHSIDFPKLALGKRKCEHGVILKIVSTNICGSDQHMVRGRTTAPKGLILGHEITCEVIEVGRDVEFIKVGDLVSVPFHIACGRCRNCKERATGVCLNVNPARPGAAYAYVGMSGHGKEKKNESGYPNTRKHFPNPLHVKLEDSDSDSHLHFSSPATAISRGKRKPNGDTTGCPITLRRLVIPKNYDRASFAEIWRAHSLSRRHENSIRNSLDKPSSWSL